MFYVQIHEENIEQNLFNMAGQYIGRNAQNAIFITQFEMPAYMFQLCNKPLCQT